VCRGWDSDGAPPTVSSSDLSGQTTSTAMTSTDPWAHDLDLLDSTVRMVHPDPFANTPENVWEAKLDELRGSLPIATPDQRIVQLASLVGLLDTHSALDGPFHQFDVLAYPFSDGWFVVRARDPALLGSKLVSIDTHPIADVEAAMRPLVAADNESGKLDGLEAAMTNVEFLHGLGLVADPTMPAFTFESSDGTEMTVDLTASDQETWQRELGIIGGLLGTSTEAVARRYLPVWSRLDEPSMSFLIGYNDDTSDGLTTHVADMRSALDSGAATRVVLDMRYLLGGNGSLAQPLIDALVDDERINRPGGLTLLIGRENVSAGTVVATAIDTRTKAVLIGEMTPARG
jgi:hypothetical protein